MFSKLKERGKKLGEAAFSMANQIVFEADEAKSKDPLEELLKGNQELEQMARGNPKVTIKSKKNLEKSPPMKPEKESSEQMIRNLIEEVIEEIIPADKETNENEVKEPKRGEKAAKEEEEEKDNRRDPLEEVPNNSGNNKKAVEERDYFDVSVVECLSEQGVTLNESQKEALIERFSSILKKNCGKRDSELRLQMEELEREKKKREKENDELRGLLRKACSCFRELSLGAHKAIIEIGSDPSEMERESKKLIGLSSNHFLTPETIGSFIVASTLGVFSSNVQSIRKSISQKNMALFAELKYSFGEINHFRETKGELERLKSTLQKLQSDSKDLLKKEKGFEKLNEETAKREKSLRETIDALTNSNTQKDSKVLL